MVVALEVYGNLKTEKSGRDSLPDLLDAACSEEGVREEHSEGVTGPK